MQKARLGARRRLAQREHHRAVVAAQEALHVGAVAQDVGAQHPLLQLRGHQQVVDPHGLRIVAPVLRDLHAGAAAPREVRPGRKGGLVVAALVAVLVTVGVQHAAGLQHAGEAEALVGGAPGLPAVVGVLRRRGLGPAAAGALRLPGAEELGVAQVDVLGRHVEVANVHHRPPRLPLAAQEGSHLRIPLPPAGKGLLRPPIVWRVRGE
mmetsp:Transcript_41433/g.104146  ORF Transcript_41433/g.104146 Transcript_41433/m.104146 type:complete len:208 (-) Transcript_41433:779-1402(-)